MLYIILLVLATYWIYVKFVKVLSYWKVRNVPYTDANIFVGGLYRTLMRKESFYDNILRLYNQFNDSRYYGTFQFNNPVFVVRDLELIKKVGVKDFDHFIDHNVQINGDADELFSKNLMFLTGDDWKDMRATLSPAFTGSKMRGMFHLMDNCTKEFLSYFAEKLTDDAQTIEIEMKDTTSRFANDVIASVAFGIDCNSLKFRDNDFFKMGQSISKMSSLMMIKILLINTSKRLAKILKLRVLPEVSDFFERTISETIRIRESNNIVRPDMLHLLMESRRGRLKHEEEQEDGEQTAGFANVSESHVGKETRRMKPAISDLDIAAQAMLFFLAGFETVSVAFSFLTYELAVNVDVQEKLQREIDEVLQNNDDVDYSSLLNMKYLDMVICEVLRMWPPAPGADRKCVKEYTIPRLNSDESDLTIETGTIIMIPILGVHMDAAYFPNPKKFDPERFNDENKRLIKPYTYLPFGIGPRNCIGSRFALLELKLFIFRLLAKYTLVPVERTPIPMCLSKKKMSLGPDNGFWLGLKLRK